MELGIKLFTEGRQLYRSAEGASAEALELESITLALKRHAQVLHASQPAQIKVKGDLQDIARNCEALAAELLTLVEELKGQRHGEPKMGQFQGRRSLCSKEKEIFRAGRASDPLASTDESIYRQRFKVCPCDRRVEYNIDILPANNIQFFLAMYTR